MSRRIHLLSTGESGSFPSFPFMDEQTLVPTSNGIGNRDPVYSTQGEVSANISGGPPAPLVEECSILLIAWKLSGVISQAKTFRQEWSNYWQEFVPPHRLFTSQPGLLGVVGVLDGVPIPCQLL